MASRQRAIESVRVITDLLYERRTRGIMLTSSITRGADLEEIKDRKKSYDDVFVRYNSTLQSNLFRIREMLHSSDYTYLEAILEGPIRNLFAAEDACLTSSFDAVVSPNPLVKATAKDVLLKCPFKDNNTEPIARLHQAILDCDYAFTVYRFVQARASESEHGTLDAPGEAYIQKQCAMH
jgi:hypothetical protein